jgi:hypothetical protein
MWIWRLIAIAMVVTLGALAGSAAASRAAAQGPGPAGETDLLPPLIAALVGDAEVPGPGDPAGLGAAGIALDPALRTICYAVHVANVAPATAAHIHEGAAGVDGPVVVPLGAPTDGAAAGCVENLDPALVLRIQQNPDGFYVNVHNAAYPVGAVRGQLGR